jgi:hypothetical protein
MTSLKQIEANRHNALKSTGPRTAGGKLRSRQMMEALRQSVGAEKGGGAEARKGRLPKPFMLGGKAAAADAVWHSNRNGKDNKASFLKTIEQPKPASAEANRAEDAAVHRPSAVQASGPPACRF